MKESNKELKSAFDKFIGEDPLVKEEDKKKFQTRLQQSNISKEKKHWFPKVVTVLLFCVAILFAWISLPVNTPLDDTSLPIDSADEFNEDKIVSHEKVRGKIDEIISKYRINMSKEEVEELFGEGYVYSGNTETDGRWFEAIEYLYFTPNEAKERLHLPFRAGVSPFENGEVGLTFNIMWYGDGTTYAFLNYLNGQKLSTITFYSDGKVFEDDRFLANTLYEVDASGFVIKAIAASLNKDPLEVTEEDLINVEEIILKPDETETFTELYSFDVEILSEMKNLKTLHLKEVGLVGLSYEDIGELTSLQQLTLENVVTGDLEAFMSLGNLQYLDIQETDTTTVSRIANHPSLKEIVLNKEKVTDWELLKESGITVTSSE